MVILLEITSAAVKVYNNTGETDAPLINNSTLPPATKEAPAKLITTATPAFFSAILIPLLATLIDTAFNTPPKLAAFVILAKAFLLAITLLEINKGTFIQEPAEVEIIASLLNALNFSNVRLLKNVRGIAATC